MAEKAEKKKEEAAPAHGEKKAGGGGLLTKMPVLLAGAMIIEAVVLFAGFKFLGGSPKPAAAQGVELTEGAKGEKAEGGKEGEGSKEGAKEGGGGVKDKKSPAEIPVVDFRALNCRAGHTVLYDVAVVIITTGEHEAVVKQKVTDRGNLIRDRVRTIIAEADPEKLGGRLEPGLETLRRQIKYQLDQILGEGLVDEVVISKWTPFRTEF